MAKREQATKHRPQRKNNSRHADSFRQIFPRIFVVCSSAARRANLAEKLLLVFSTLNPEQHRASLNMAGQAGLQMLKLQSREANMILKSGFLLQALLPL